MICFSVSTCADVKLALAFFSKEDDWRVTTFFCRAVGSFPAAPAPEADDSLDTEKLICRVVAYCSRYLHIIYHLLFFFRVYSYIVPVFIKVSVQCS